jgi:CSLREA domain-containing protein
MSKLAYITALLSLIIQAPAAAQTTFTVNTTNDVDDTTCNLSHCSLREAINAANLAAGTDTIEFNIPGGAGIQIISLSSALPAVSDPVVIDGTTQSGFTTSPAIELDGSGAGSATGLRITAGSSVVRALAMHGFDDGIILDVLGGNTVEGSVIGSGGKAPECVGFGNSGSGIVIVSSNNTVGGESLAQANEILCNGADGIRIASSAGNLVRGNFIGLSEVDDPDDPAAEDLGNGRDGIRIESSIDNAIGGTGLLQGNIIARNDSAGIHIIGSLSESNNIAGNTIAHNSGDGIVLPDAGTGNTIESNDIHDNGLLGIDLGADGVTINDIGDGDAGPNDFQNFPELASVRVGAGTFIDGILRSAANIDTDLEFFGSESCDASNHGEGEAFLARTHVTTAANGEVTFSVIASAVSLGSHVTATATRDDGSTSEFSSCVQASGYMLNITPDTATVNRGAIGRFAVEVMPVGGPYNTEVALRCTQQPPFTTCTFSPDTVVPGANGVTSILNVQTNATGVISLAPITGPEKQNTPAWPGALALGLPAIALLGIIVVRRDRFGRRLAVAFAVALVLVGATLQTGCEDENVNGPTGGGTPVGAHGVVVQGMSDPIIELATTILVVTP